MQKGKDSPPIAPLSLSLNPLVLVLGIRIPLDNKAKDSIIPLRSVLSRISLVL